MPKGESARFLPCQEVRFFRHVAAGVSV
jgi:hypothetical protein